MPAGSSPKRERQHEHIEESQPKRGAEGRSTIDKHRLENAPGR
ncbi:hypothetical protein [Kitasatospora sp. CB01950]|nr:hypothetical protein [Kitasatospora sp. CB01950]